MICKCIQKCLPNRIVACLASSAIRMASASAVLAIAVSFSARVVACLATSSAVLAIAASFSATAARSAAFEASCCSESNIPDCSDARVVIPSSNTSPRFTVRLLSFRFCLVKEHQPRLPGVSWELREEVRANKYEEIGVEVTECGSPHNYAC